MNNQTMAWSLLVPWAVTYAWSFVAFMTTTPTGDSFARGLNRIGVFLTWQALAGVMAVGLWILSRHFDKGSAGRWFCRVPLVLAGLLVAAIAALIVWANFAKAMPA